MRGTCSEVEGEEEEEEEEEGALSIRVGFPVIRCHCNLTNNTTD